MNKIAFIGTGVMGTGMVCNLLKAGYQVSVFNRTKAKATTVVKSGAKWCDSVKECVDSAEIVISMVGYPRDVEQIYFGPDGIIENAAPGTVLIDMTTTSPKLAIKIYKAAALRKLEALDAPVSGGDTGAANGTLAIMVGGNQETFDKCLPVFEAMGRNIRLEGPAGYGQHTKMANQIAIAGALAGVCEAISYGKAVGLDLKLMLDTISSGAAGSWQMSYNGPKMIDGNYEAGFFSKHFIKDMAIAAEESCDRGQPLPVLGTVLEMFRALEAEGYGDEGTQSLIRAYTNEEE